MPWMGGCRYKGTGSWNKDSPVGVLGFVTGDIVEEDEGVLRLEYHNGDICGGGEKSTVHIHFTCGPGTREVSPEVEGVMHTPLHTPPHTTHPTPLYSHLTHTSHLSTL